MQGYNGDSVNTASCNQSHINTVPSASVVPNRNPKPRPSPLLIAHESSAHGSTKYGTYSLSPSNTAEHGDGAGGLAAAGNGNFWTYLASPQSPFVIQLQDHCHHQWLAWLLTVVLLLGMFYVVAVSHTPPAANCETSFGTFLGEHQGVAVYSNCRYGYTGDGTYNFLSDGLRKVSTGPKWLSLEYARRVWILTQQLTFPTVEEPAELMQVPYATSVARNEGDVSVPLQHFFNLDGPPRSTKEVSATDEHSSSGRDSIPGTVSPRANGDPLDLRAAILAPGDLIVYAKHQPTLASGHIAVATQVKGPFSRVEDIGTEVVWGTPQRPVSPNIQMVRGPGGRTLLNTTDINITVAAKNGEGCLYYAVYVAEQNWGNQQWTDNPSKNAVAATFLPRRATRRDYARVLLLREYYPEQVLYLEDTHGQRIVGWVRAGSKKGSPRP